MASTKVYYLNETTRTWVEKGDLVNKYELAFLLDEQFDSGKIQFVSSSEDLLLKNTIVKFDGIVMLCDGGSKSVWLNGMQKYLHSIGVVELSDLLRGISIENIANYSERYTLLQLFNRILHISGKEDIIELSTDFPLDASQKVKEVFQFTDATLHDVFSKIARTYDMIYELEIGDYDSVGGKMSINFLTLDGIGKSTALLSTLNGISGASAISTEEGSASKVISNLKNCVGTLPIHYPSKNSGSRLINNEYLELPTKINEILEVEIYPYYEIFDSASVQYDPDVADDFGYVQQGKAVFPFTITPSSQLDIYLKGTYANPISIYLEEKKAYDLLYSYASGSKEPQFEQNTMWYQQGTNRFYCYPTMLNNFSAVGISVPTDTVLQSAGLLQSGSTALSGSTGWLKPELILIRIKYIPQFDTVMTSENDNEFVKEVYFNQDAKLVYPSQVKGMLDNYIKNMESYDLVRTQRYSTLAECEALLGMNFTVDNKNYVVSNVSVVKEANGLYYVTVGLNLNHTRRSEYISADYSITVYDIPTEDIVKRYTHRKMVIELSKKQIPLSADSGNEITVNYDFFKYFLDALRTSRNGFPLDYTLIRTTYNPLDYDYLLTHSVISVQKNSLSITTNIDDNAIIGYRGMAQMGTSMPAVTPVRYTDENGEFIGIRVSHCSGEADNAFYTFMNNTTKSRELPLLSYSNYNSLYSSGLTNILEFKDYNYNKDAYEATSFIIQVDYKSNDGVVVFEDFINHISLVNNIDLSNVVAEFYTIGLDTQVAYYRSMNSAKLVETVTVDLSSSNVITEPVVGTPYLVLYLNTGAETALVQNTHYNILIKNSSNGETYLGINDYTLGSTGFIRLYFGKQMLR